MDVGEEYAHAVGEKRPNGWGLHDLHGNVREWCDRYGMYPAGVTDPEGDSHGLKRLYRGGDWNDFARNFRSAHRGSVVPGHSRTLWASACAEGP